MGRSTVSGWEDIAVVQAGEGEGLTLSRVLWGRSGGHHESLQRDTGAWAKHCSVFCLQVPQSQSVGLTGLQPCNSNGFVFTTSWGHVQRGQPVWHPELEPQILRWTLSGETWEGWAASGLASFILSTGLVCKLMPAGGSQACRGLAACLPCRDKGLFTQLHFVWFMTSQVALSRRGTSPREWEVVVTMSDHPVAACSVDFPVCPVWLGIKLGVAGIGTTVQCAVAGERRGVLMPGLTFFGSVGGKLDLHFGCQEVALQEYPSCEQGPVTHSGIEQ